MGNSLCATPSDPLTKLLKSSIATQTPPHPTNKELNEIWDFMDIDQNDLLDNREIVKLVQKYLQIQDAVIQKYPKSKRKAFRADHLTPGINLGDLMLKYEKLRSRRQLYEYLDSMEHQEHVVVFIKRLFGLTPKQHLTKAMFNSKGQIVLFQPWNLSKETLKFDFKEQGAFNFNPDSFEGDPKMEEAFKASHYHVVFDQRSHEAALKLLRMTLRKLGKVDNLGLPKQTLTEEEKRKKAELQRSSVPEIHEKLSNDSHYPDGTIVEVYSGSEGGWIIGEIIGAKSQHAINVRYRGQSKFLNPHNKSTFRLIENVVGTPYGIGFLKRVRHDDYFCEVQLDWCNAWVHGSQVQTVVIQSIHLVSHLQDRSIQGQLLVKVVKAIELPKLDVGGLCDPWVEVRIPSKTGQPICKKSKIIRRNQNPKFDQVLDFKEYEVHEEEICNGEIRVYDADEDSNEFIGSALFKIPTRNDMVDDYFLHLRLSDGTHRGVIVLQSILIRDDLPESERTRMKNHFTKRMGDPVQRGKKAKRKRKA